MRNTSCLHKLIERFIELFVVEILQFEISISDSLHWKVWGWHNYKNKILSDTKEKKMNEISYVRIIIVNKNINEGNVPVVAGGGNQDI